MKPPSIDIVNISLNSRLHSTLKRETNREREEKLAAEHMAGPQFDCQVKKLDEEEGEVEDEHVAFV